MKNSSLFSEKDKIRSFVERYLHSGMIPEYPDNIKYEFINGDQNVAADSLSRDICATIKTTESITDFEKEMRSFHKLHGHPGLTKTFQTLNLSKKLTKSQKNSITQIISNCDFCQLNKVTKHKYGHISGRVRTESPFVHISSDIFGPFESKFYKNDYNNRKLYIITFTDRCTLYTQIFYSTSICASDIISAFKNVWVQKCGYPESFLSDNGPCYMSNSFKTYLQEKNIKQKICSAHNPTGNSLSEKISFDIVTVLKIYKN
ncbi:putative transposable element [Pseudoloma neurophilia]|uniref:Putative transposable element n=1 Tax=Pseudoloma neurophilia TaxID=146866 RepID=A0A0R0M3P0_9MICR|nr:putative transposable element [Pseudoloma neurophilia]